MCRACARASIFCISQSGDECLDWKDALSQWQNKEYQWDPWLALSAGLDKNLCRNPTWYKDVNNPLAWGPWCLYRLTNGNVYAKSCGIPLCGAGADAPANRAQRQPFPMVATFEGLFEADVNSLPTVYQGIVPSRPMTVGAVLSGLACCVRSDKFCGARSLPSHRRS